MRSGAQAGNWWGKWRRGLISSRQDEGLWERTGGEGERAHRLFRLASFPPPGLLSWASRTSFASIKSFALPLSTSPSHSPDHCRFSLWINLVGIKGVWFRPSSNYHSLPQISPEFTGRSCGVKGGEKREHMKAAPLHAVIITPVSKRFSVTDAREPKHSIAAKINSFLPLVPPS